MFSQVLDQSPPAGQGYTFDVFLLEPGVVVLGVFRNSHLVLDSHLNSSSAPTRVKPP